MNEDVENFRQVEKINLKFSENYVKSNKNITSTNNKKSIQVQKTKTMKINVKPVGCEQG